MNYPQDFYPTTHKDESVLVSRTRYKTLDGAWKAAYRLRDQNGIKGLYADDYSNRDGRGGKEYAIFHADDRGPIKGTYLRHPMHG